MTEQKRRTYTQQFKIDAVRLITEQGYKYSCPFGKAAQIRKISVNVHKKEDNRPIQQNVLRFVSDKNESGTII